VNHAAGAFARANIEPDAPDDWDVTTAADTVMDRLGRHLRNAPDVHDENRTSWRT
jgi:hypothetical protein